MTSPLESLVQSGTKVWLDSIDPDLVVQNRKLGATGATSNPIIVSNLIKTGRFDSEIRALKKEGMKTPELTWVLTDRIVSQAEEVFLDVYQSTKGNDGYVSFEVDPLLEDKNLGPAMNERVKQYVELGKKWAVGHPNRLIKVPATEAGLAALEELVAAGVNVNVTLIFSSRQYEEARDAVWKGAQKRASLDQFKSVFSIFVSRLDVYAEKAAPSLSAAAAGQVGILNGKRVWQQNCEFWAKNPTPLQQEMIFASTGTKKASDPAWKYVEAFAGSDIETNPPETNDLVQASGRSFERNIDKMPAAALVQEIDDKIDWNQLEKTLMSEGLEKFAQPQKALLELIDSLS